MKILNSKNIPFVKTNGHNLWISAAANELLNNPAFVDFEVDRESKLISIQKNDESGEFKVTRTRDGTRKISSSFFTSMPDRKRFRAHGGNGMIEFSIL